MHAPRSLNRPRRLSRPCAASPHAQAINAAIGGGCLLGFLIFRSFMPQYQLRAHLPYVTIRPPPLPTGLKRVYGWIKPGERGGVGLGGGDR